MNIGDRLPHRQDAPPLGHWRRRTTADQREAKRNPTMEQPPDDQAAREAAIRAFKIADEAERAAGRRVDLTSDEVRGFRKKRPVSISQQTADPKTYYSRYMPSNHKIEVPFSSAFQFGFGAAAGITTFRLVVWGVVAFLLYLVLLSITH
jgi:hypothetical protein